MKRHDRQWDNNAEFGSDILGNGACFGDLAGKVKTRQIGFIRNDGSTKKTNVSRKSSVSNKGRSQTAKACNAKTKRS